MNENLANEIRKTIESVKDMKIQASGINNYLSILEGMIRADYQKQVDDAYQRGYDKGYADKTNSIEVCNKIVKDIQDEAYQRGLNEAWEAAKKIVLSPDEGGTSLPDLFAMFGNGSKQSVFRNYSASEAIAKQKAYEEKQKEDVYDKGCKGCKWEAIGSDDYPCSICCNSRRNIYKSKDEEDAESGEF